MAAVQVERIHTGIKEILFLLPEVVKNVLRCTPIGKKITVEVKTGRNVPHIF